jgi:hypothetical protein
MQNFMVSLSLLQRSYSLGLDMQQSPALPTAFLTSTYTIIPARRADMIIDRRTKILYPRVSSRINIPPNRTQLPLNPWKELPRLIINQLKRAHRSTLINYMMNIRGNLTKLIIDIYTSA